MTINLKKLFERWGESAKPDYLYQQWLLSKWEVMEGVVWPQEKIETMIQSIVHGLDLKRDESLVDLGCGGGWILQYLKPYALKTFGLDFSYSMLLKAQQYSPSEDFICGEITRLPISDESVDCALSYFVFLNFTDDQFVQKAFGDAFRVLKRGGRLLVGQLPDQSRSNEYDRAKQNYIQYCRENFQLGESHRDICRAEQKLFDFEQLKRFFDKEKIQHEFRDSFNPFFRPGESPSIKWRQDIVLKK